MNGFKWMGALAAAVLLLAGIYWAAYQAMLRPEIALHLVRYQKGGRHVWVASPTYRIPGERLADFFGPVHEVDRILRPRRWSPEGPGGLSAFVIAYVPDGASLTPDLGDLDPVVAPAVLRWAEREAKQKQ